MISIFNKKINKLKVINKTVYIIHCTYDDDINFLSLNALYKNLKSIDLEFDIKIICVTNKSSTAENLLLPFPDSLSIKGSNSKREFSAWYEGWLKISNKVADADIVILTNDTLLKNQPYLFCIDLVIVSAIKSVLLNDDTNYICGVTENLNCVVKKYITSFLLILDGLAAKKILPLISTEMNHAHLSNVLNSSSVIKSIDKNYEFIVNKWLTSPGPNSWYGASDQGYSSLIRDKALSILLEHSISLRANILNIKIIDIFEFTNSRSLKIQYRIRQIMRRHMVWYISRNFHRIFN